MQNVLGPYVQQALLTEQNGHSPSPAATGVGDAAEPPPPPAACADFSPQSAMKHRAALWKMGAIVTKKKVDRKC